MPKLFQIVIAALALGLLIVGSAPTAQAQSTLIKQCSGRGSTLSIPACTRLLEMRHLTKIARSTVYNNRGVAYQRKGEIARALNDFDEALKLNRNNTIAYVNRGNAHFGEGNFDKALRDYEQAIRLNPRIADAYLGRGLVRENKGDQDGALQDVERSLKLKRSLPLALLARERLRMNGAGGQPSPDNKAHAATPRPPTSAPAFTQPKADQPQTASTSTGPSPSAAAPSTAAPPQIADGSRVALVIGNSAYRYANKLNNPRNDAGDLAAVLRRLGFDVVEGRDLDKRAMEDKIRDFGRKLDHAGLALFFYAGHGIAVNGKNYLIPIDAKLERPGDLTLDTVEVSDVLAQMESQNRVNLVFLDACRDNPLTRSFARRLGTRSASVSQGLSPIQSGIGTLISFATQPGNVALDGRGRNSPFTTALLKHLATPGTDIALIMRRVRADVMAATRQQQVPWGHSSLVGDVVLAR